MNSTIKLYSGNAAYKKSGRGGENSWKGESKRKPRGRGHGALSEPE